MGALKSQVLENASMENTTTKRDVLQGWKMQVLKTQVRVRKGRKHKYGKRKYICTIILVVEEITMELSLLVEWVSLCLGFYLQGGPKMAPFLYALTLPNINQFSKLVHCQNQEKICNNTVAIDPTTPQVCRYTTLWKVNVLKVTNENKTTKQHILRN